MSRSTGPLPPLRRNVRVRWEQAAAFRRFTDGIAQWWPLRTHSVGGERADRVVFEGRVGGEIYEVDRDGSRCVWGTVTRWEPPQRVAFTWHPGQGAETAGDIEVVFVPAGRGTRLELTHSGWERLGALARKARFGYGIGWRYVLAFWAARPRHPLVLLLDLVGPVLRRRAERAERELAGR